MIYAFLNQKGGVGKTTLSIHTAAALASKKRRVLLVDADPQGSAVSWASGHDSAGFDVVSFAKPLLHQEIDRIRAEYDDVVIDGPPRLANLARSIILAADVIVIPVQPSAMDVWEAAKTIDLVDEARKYKPSLRCCIVINRRIANTAIGRDVRKALGQLSVPVMKSDIGQRVSFAEIAADGTTVLKHKRSKAAKEIRKFVNELEKVK